MLFTVSSGSVTVNEDSSVQILAEEAVEIETLDSKVKYKFDWGWKGL